MEAQEGMQLLVALLGVGRMDASDLEKAIEIAAKNSPSRAIKAGQLHYFVKYSSDRLAALTYGKGTRWLAVLRRDEGEQAFREACTLLRAQTTTWRLGSGEPVIDRLNSHFATHAAAYPQLAQLLPEALQKINSQGRNFVAEEVDMGRIVGESILVETCLGDEVIFAQRLNRQGLTRFVKNRQPVSCRYITVLLKKASEGNFYILMTVFVGRRVPDEPWSEFANRESVRFWNSHALIWDYEEIVPGTETDKCPW